MARWTASAKWAAGPALDGQRDMPLALSLSEGLGDKVWWWQRGRFATCMLAILLGALRAGKSSCLSCVLGCCGRACVALWALKGALFCFAPAPDELAAGDAAFNSFLQCDAASRGHLQTFNFASRKNEVLL